MSYFRNIAQNFAITYAHNKMKDSLYKSLNIDIINQNYERIPDNGKKYMLYAHVPFCHVFCPYCSFHKYKYDKNTCKQYFENLREEMRQVKEIGYDFETMYIGGGTPLIDSDELFKTVELAKNLFNIKDISCETDPNNIDPKILEKFKGYIDRISVGVQSFDNEILKKVARYHKFGSQEILIEKLQNAIGILPATSLDLIFNLPFQAKEQLIKDIEISKMLLPEQITFYPLMKSPITRESIAQTLGISDEDNEQYFYDVIRKEMKGYFQNNAWAFSRTKDSLADEYVCSNHEYVGVGSGAFSFLNKKLLVNAYNLEDYGKKIQTKQSPIIAICEFKKSEILKYIFMTKLFDGNVNIKDFNKTNNANIKKDLFIELSLLKLVNAIYEKDGNIKPTEFGNYLSLVLMKDFYTGMDKVRAAFKDDAKIKSTKKLKVMEEDDVNYTQIDKKAQRA